MIHLRMKSRLILKKARLSLIATLECIIWLIKGYISHYVFLTSIAGAST